LRTASGFREENWRLRERVRLRRLVEGLGLEVATPSEAREILRLKGRDLGNLKKEKFKQCIIWWRWGGCRSPLTASRCAKLVVSKHELKERASMGEATIIGVDLAKNVFQVHGAAADGAVSLQR
jgi:hypothetical protein